MFASEEPGVEQAMEAGGMGPTGLGTEVTLLLCRQLPEDALLI